MKHLISLDDLDAADIAGLLSTADHMAEVLERPQPKVPALRTKTVCSLFFEVSTPSSCATRPRGFRSRSRSGVMHTS